MPERQDRLGDDQLARALRALGAEIAYPPTPDLAAAVRARLAADRPTARAPRRGWLAAPPPRRVALALALLVVVVAATLAFSSEAREAVAGRLGLPGITIVYVTPTTGATANIAPTPPGTPPATATARATPASAGERLGLGRRVTLAEARGLVAFPVLVPDLPSLGAPDEIYHGEPPLGGQIAFVWHPRAELPPAAESGVGLLVTQFQGRLDPGFMKKLIGGKTSLSAVTVGGAEGYWITGEPHEFLYTNTRGTFPERTRLAGNVLLWSNGGVTYRIEGARTLEEALRIAAAMR